MVDAKTGRQYVEDENDVLTFHCDNVNFQYTPKKFKELYNELKQSIEEFIGMSVLEYQWNCFGGEKLPSKDFTSFHIKPNCYEDINLYGSDVVTMRCSWDTNSRYFHLPSGLFTGEENMMDTAKKVIKCAFQETNNRIDRIVKTRDAAIESLKKFNIKIN